MWKNLGRIILSFISKNWMNLVILAILIIMVAAFIRYMDQKNTLAFQKAEEETAQRKQEYAADQKAACLAIYKQESSKWGNAVGWNYNDFSDDCTVQYKSDDIKTRKECDAMYKGDDGKVATFFRRDWILCYDGLFETTF